MKRTTLLLSLLLLSMILALAAVPLRAQDKPKSDPESQADVSHSRRAVNWYRVDITVNEFDDNKKVNSRHYTVHMNDDGERSVTDFGTRVPVPSGSGGQFNYIDVGLNIALRVVQAGGERNMLDMAFKLSSFAIPEQAKQSAPGVPILRQVSTANSIPVATGKPIVVASLDDPNSTKRYEFEATLTKF